ncbi:MAG: hypothetical protein HPY64_01670 [Anaerolineae bacterium]|nr:hypothetical protein [Anaerolineae bacterium]
MRYPYLLWQLDGALFNTTGAIRRALGAALADCGATITGGELDDLLATVDSALISAAAARFGVPRQALQGGWEARYRAILLRDQPPFPGAVDLCRRAVEAGGRNYAFSFRHTRDMERSLAAYGLTDLFTGWLADDSGGADQPALALLVAACSLPPGTALVISGRRRDAELARALGLAACLVRTPEAAGDFSVFPTHTALETFLFGPGDVVS